MPAQAPGMLVGGGGGGAAASPKTALCAAFAAAVEAFEAPEAREKAENEFEADTRDPVASFEDLFEDTVKRTELIKETEFAAESQSLALNPAEAAALVAVSSDAKVGAVAIGCLADERDRKRKALSAITSVPIRVKSTFGDRFGKGTRPMPLAKLEKKAIELKGPGETENPKGEYAKQAQLEKDSSPFDVGSCDCG